MRSLLAAVDLSESSMCAVRRVVQWAARTEARVTVLHVIDESIPLPIQSGMVDAIQAWLGSRLDAINTDRDFVVRVESGHPATTISAVASEIQSDCIALGRHRRRVLGDVFTGTTAERVIRLSGRPVLSVSREPSGDYRRILVGVDRSEPTRYMLDVLMNLGVVGDAELEAVYGHVPHAKGSMIYAGVDPQTIEQYEMDSLDSTRASLEAFVANTALAGTKAVTSIIHANPFDAIVQRLEATDADLVVVGTRTHTGVRRLMIGSTADAVMRGVDRDVLVVPPAAVDE